MLLLKDNLLVIIIIKVIFPKSLYLQKKMLPVNENRSIQSFMCSEVNREKLTGSKKANNINKSCLKFGDL